MRKALMSMALALAVAVTVQAAGTVVVTKDSDLSLPKSFVKYSAAWTSDASGNTTGNAFYAPGLLWQISIMPDTGATQPTTLYDMSIVTSAGTDILLSNGTALGADLSNSTPKVIQFDPPLIVDNSRSLDIRVTNAGNAKTGTVVFWVQR